MTSPEVAPTANSVIDGYSVIGPCPIDTGIARTPRRAPAERLEMVTLMPAPGSSTTVATGAGRLFCGPLLLF